MIPHNFRKFWNGQAKQTAEAIENRKITQNNRDLEKQSRKNIRVTRALNKRMARQLRNNSK